MSTRVREAVRAARAAGVPALEAALQLLEGHAPAHEVTGVYEGVLAADTRRARGAWYTPEGVVAEVLDRALDPVLDACPPERLADLRVLDPCCGGGNFLLGAWARLRDRLATSGHEDPTRSAAACLVGVDLDRDALTLTGRLLARAAGADVATLVCADALLTDGPPVDVIVGNPPFLNQLESATVASRARVAALRARFPGLVAPYTDPAWLHLVAGLRAVRPGGRVGLLLPRSFLAARDAAAVRAAVATEGTVRAVWDGGAVFPGVAVAVCAVVVERGPADPGLTHAPSWAHLLEAPAGVPRVRPRVGGTLADIATSAADFRDEYYGLVPHVLDVAFADDTRFPPLLTTGHVDAAASTWGQRPARFAKRSWEFPRVDRAALPPRMALWSTRRLVPKLLVATQTRAIEAVADPDGRWLTVTPLISVFPAPGRLWHGAAVLLSPVATSVAYERFGGAALTTTTLKLSASQALTLPTPEVGADWDAAARHVEAAHADPANRGVHLRAAGAAMLAAYGVDDDALLAGWLSRVVTSRGSTQPRR
jgi:SAM-dependent methyltransferase